MKKTLTILLAIMLVVALTPSMHANNAAFTLIAEQECEEVGEVQAFKIDHYNSDIKNSAHPSLLIEYLEEHFDEVYDMKIKISAYYIKAGAEATGQGGFFNADGENINDQLDELGLSQYTSNNQAFNLNLTKEIDYSESFIRGNLTGTDNLPHGISHVLFLYRTVVCEEPEDGTLVVTKSITLDGEPVDENDEFLDEVGPFEITIWKLDANDQPTPVKTDQEIYPFDDGYQIDLPVGDYFVFESMTGDGIPLYSEETDEIAGETGVRVRIDPEPPKTLNITNQFFTEDPPEEPEDGTLVVNKFVTLNGDDMANDSDFLDGVGPFEITIWELDDEDNPTVFLEDQTILPYADGDDLFEIDLAPGEYFLFESEASGGVSSYSEETDEIDGQEGVRITIDSEDQDPVIIDITNSFTSDTQPEEFDGTLVVNKLVTLDDDDMEEDDDFLEEVGAFEITIWELDNEDNPTVFLEDQTIIPYAEGDEVFEIDLPAGEYFLFESEVGDGVPSYSDDTEEIEGQEGVRVTILPEETVTLDITNSFTSPAEEITIEDPEIPEAPGEETPAEEEEAEEEEIIMDDPIPLGDLPQTGHGNPIWFMISGGLFIGLGVITKKFIF